jgi:hypothetical protein
MPPADPNFKKYLIISPHLSQSISCAKRLIANKNIRVTGAYLPDEGPLSSPHISRYYNNIIVMNSLDGIFDEYDCIIPTGASSTKVIFEYVDKFRCGDIHLDIRILQSSDKLATLSLAESLGIHIPMTWSCFEDIPAGNNAIFYKPKYEGASGARAWAACRDQVPDSVQNDNYLFQEKIEGPGVYGYGFIADEGKILSSFAHYEIISYPVDGGSAAVLRPYHHKSLHEYSARLIKAMSYTGWGLVEYKWCPRRKDFVLMEINAKLWASIELAFCLNPDFSQLILSTQTTPAPVHGLIWPDRLFRCGPQVIWSARKYLIKYNYIFEPVAMRRVANKIKQSFLNIFE